MTNPIRPQQQNPYVEGQSGYVAPPPEVSEVEKASVGEQTTNPLYSTYIQANYPLQTFSSGVTVTAEASRPVLTPLEGLTRTSAEPAVQNLVRGFIAKQITLLLPSISQAEMNDIYNHLFNGAELTNPKLAKAVNEIKPQLEESVKKQARLKNFTLTALYKPDEKAWVQTPMPPMNKEQQAEVKAFFEETLLNIANDLVPIKPGPDASAKAMEEYEHAKERLMSAVAGGKPHPSIINILDQITKEAAAITQKKFSLPETWSAGTTDITNWTPNDVSSILAPKNVAMQRVGDLMQNIDTIINNFTKLGKVLSDSLPDDNPAKAIIQNFIDVVIDATWGYKKQLEEYQIMLAQQTEENIKFIGEDQKSRNALAADQLKDVQKSQEKQHKMEKFSFAMKIVGPTIAALSVAIGLIVSVATLGAGAALASPLVLAGLAVGVAMTTYSVVDAATGITGKIMEGFNNMIDKITGDAPEWAKAMTKLIVVVTAVAMVAIMVAAIASGSGAGAAANVATQTIANAAKQAAVVAVKQLAIQASLIFVMSSGVLLEFPQEMLKLTGLNDTTVDVLKYMILAMEIVAVIAVAAKASSSAGKSASTATASVAQQTSQIAAEQSSTISQRINALAKAAKDQLIESIETTLKTLKKNMDALLERLQSPSLLLGDLKSAGSSTVTWARQSAQDIVSPYVQIAKGIDGLKNATMAVTDAKDLIKGGSLAILATFGRLAGPVTNLGSASYRIALNNEQAKIYLELGEIEKAQAILQVNMDNVNDAVKQLESAETGASDVAKFMDDTINNLLRSLSAMIKKLTESIQG